MARTNRRNSIGLRTIEISDEIIGVKKKVRKVPCRNRTECIR